MPEPPPRVPVALPPYKLELLTSLSLLDPAFPYLRKGLGFKEIPEITVPHMADDVEHAWHLYVIQLDLERLRVGRNEMIDLLKKQGIGTILHFIPLHLHPYYRDNYGCLPNDFPVAITYLNA